MEPYSNTHKMGISKTFKSGSYEIEAEAEKRKTKRNYPQLTTRKGKKNPKIRDPKEKTLRSNEENGANTPTSPKSHLESAIRNEKTPPNTRKQRKAPPVDLIPNQNR